MPTGVGMSSGRTRGTSGALDTAGGRDGGGAGFTFVGFNFVRVARSTMRTSSAEMCTSSDELLIVAAVSLNERP